MRHELIWNAVDNLAKSNNISPSKMAKLVGLDPTTFNKSKRFRSDGKKRWPSLQSINKLLIYFNISFDEFCPEQVLNKFFELPVANFSEINLIKSLEIEQWEKMGEESLLKAEFCVLLDTQKYEPIYKFGTTIVVAKTDEIRKNDRVIVINKFNEICLYELKAIKNSYYEFVNLENIKIIESIKIDDIKLIKRIIWATQ